MRAAIPLRAGGMFSEAAPSLSEKLAGYPWPYCSGQPGLTPSYTNILTARRMAQQATGKGWFPKTIFGGAFRRGKWSATLDSFAPGCPASRLPASVRPACSVTAPGVHLLEPRFGLAIAQLITSVCSILLTLHVVNFSHLDELIT